MKTSNFILLLFVIITFASCQLRQPVVILIPAESSSVEMQSAREIRRYIYHRTKVLPEIVKGDKLSVRVKNIIVVANKESQLLKDIYPPLAEMRSDLKKDGVLLENSAEGRSKSGNCDRER